VIDQRWLLVVTLLLVLAAAAWMVSEKRLENSPPQKPLTAQISDIVAEPLRPLKPLQHLNVAAIALGESLFNEKRLSANNTISCAHCHVLALGGADGLPHSLGLDGQAGEVNTPTVFNAALNLAQFWDGRATTLETQIDGPIYNVKEMGSNWPEIIAKLRADHAYVRRFRAIYPDGIKIANIRHALASFERSLITTASRFDRYLLGSPDAITDREKQGYVLFKSYGCAACHQGANVGGNMFQKLGVMRDYFTERGNITRADAGRFNVTGQEADRYFFKVPSLRLVVLTAPYFHDGSAATLEQAIATMAWYQLGRAIPVQDIGLIIAFLRTLPGNYKGRLLLP